MANIIVIPKRKMPKGTGASGGMAIIKGTTKTIVITNPPVVVSTLSSSGNGNGVY